MNESHSKEPAAKNQRSSDRSWGQWVSDLYRNHYAAWCHALPFLAWLGLMAGLDLPWFGEDHAWKYAARTFLCLGLFLYFRPWRWYAPLNWRNIPLAILTGVGVFVLWTYPAVPWGGEYSGLQELYARFGILPLGRLPEMVSESVYAPQTAGWTLALIRLAGSAFVIAVIEEFFWRGFLYRWLISRDFLRVKLNRVDWESAAWVCVLFGLAHLEWLAAIVTGVLYLAMMIKTRDVWAVAMAHVITNLLLGIYVLNNDAYMFW